MNTNSRSLSPAHHFKVKPVKIVTPMFKYEWKAKNQQQITEDLGLKDIIDQAVEKKGKERKNKFEGK